MQPKTKKILIVSSIIGAIVVIAGIIIVRRRKQRTQLEQTILSGSPNVDNIGDKAVGKLIEWPLKYGSGYRSDSERNCVKTVQEWINKKIIENNVYALPMLVVDGHFGDATQGALQKIAGVKQVSYTLHNTMESYVKAGGIGVFLNNLFSINPETL